ncbi:MAG: hypothetical protein UU48_C0005G0033 [Candidatus Uhrbacteria bacterium GW2011_GWF2_41_16]|jgi:hypothetical protein|uniref:PrgI family protein n=2 Tax=Candidatus Uhriibacteriota TaxID=1752732 RepID=A0A0G0YCY3_9BACT|nr:MAG: hypothetical protein UU31_C0001G0032 [Candidatus Uhrbacteria bacterium GW2011_GWA2_41_10]KKR87259.1 MAG: hypothetical protein UU35_C0004G0032 [Candidatus Uhrbacteria bacterium GW2011_GWC2_41_11]KKR98177.1 MAG: hypothetical protein UU48_C0005G0033 [Candidatus Uhrbacteria bacterium GW2011_GWF2_41_16]HBO99857.1 hypothetical protein [Candidatus Uhrbacteria bacterium]
MPDQYVVPQFIEVEDKILGPLSVRQFLILLVGFMMDVILYKLLSFVVFLLVAIPIIVFVGVLALTKVNGMPFHFFLLNIIQSFRKPKLRIWDKQLTDEELRLHLGEAAPVVLSPFIRKAPMTTSRLQELTLVVNTGGVYRPEDED